LIFDDHLDLGLRRDQRLERVQQRVAGGQIARAKRKRARHVGIETGQAGQLVALGERDDVVFARTAALIEGLGARYDTRFNGVTFASPVALRLQREIAALGDPVDTLADALEALTDDGAQLGWRSASAAAT